MDLDALQDLELRDADGEPRRLGDFFDARPTLLIFLRHFGWLLCREHAAQLRDEYPRIRESGAEVVAIGTGTADQVRDFVEQERIPYPVLSDDEGRAAGAASIERVGMLRLFDPASLPGGLRAWRSGHRIGVSGRRVDQLGASFVVEPGPRLRYSHRDAHTADHAPLDELLGALA